MARIRTIKPEFPQSESMGNVSRDIRGHFIKKAIPAEVRREIARRHNCRPGESVDVKCAYCEFIGGVHWIVQRTDRGAGWVAFTGLEMDHVEPELVGGPNAEWNIVLACRPCNRSKGAKHLTAWRVGHA